MGRTYVASKAGVEDFDKNFAGAMLIGLVHEKCGLPVANDRFELTDPPNAPWQADAALAATMAEQLSRVSDEALVAVATQYGIPYGLWGDVPEAFPTYIRQWQTFLESCEGYEVLS